MKVVIRCENTHMKRKQTVMVDKYNEKVWWYLSNIKVFIKCESIHQNTKVVIRYKNDYKSK